MGLTSFSRYRPRSGAGAFIEAKINAAVTASVTNWANKVFADSQELVPVDTGDLKASGSVVITTSGKSAAAAVVYTAEYAAYVEFGTGQRGAASPGAGPYPYNPNWPGMAAQPYLRPAFDENRASAVPMTKEQVLVSLK